MTKPRIKKVKAPVVQKSKIIEIIAERLSSIETVPPEEQGKMVMNACNAAKDYVEKIERKVKLLETENKVLKLALADVAEGWDLANSKRGDWGLTYTAEEYAEKAMRKAEALTKKEAK